MPTSVRAAWMSFTRALAARRRPPPTTSSTSSAQISFDVPPCRRRRRLARVGCRGCASLAFRRRRGPRRRAQRLLAHPGRDEAELHAAEPDVRGAVEPALPRDTRAVDPRPIGRVHVHRIPAIIPSLDLRVNLADTLVGEAHVAVGPPADVGKGRANRIAHPFRGTLIEHLERGEQRAWIPSDRALIEQRVGE